MSSAAIVESPFTASMPAPAMDSAAPSSSKLGGWGLKLKPSFLETMKKVAIFAVDMLVNASLYLISPALFCGGFIVGVISKPQMDDALERIRHTWEKQPWHLRAVLAFAAFMALPISLSTAAFFKGGQVGATVAN